MTPEMITALVPFGIAGLAILAIVMLAMFPRDGRMMLLVFAIIVICGIFAYDRYLQNEKAQAASALRDDRDQAINALRDKLNRIAQEVRGMDSTVISKLRYESRPNFPLDDLKSATRSLCQNVLSIYEATGAALPTENCQAVMNPGPR
jgi:hypothetical protein